MTDKADSFMGLGPRDTIDPSLLAMNKHVDASMWDSPVLETDAESSTHSHGVRDSILNVASMSNSILEIVPSTGVATGLHLPTYNNRCDDSDHSWDEDDDQGEWNANMQQTLRALVGTYDGFLLSDLLPKRQRRLIHAMATVLKLNHVTLGKGKDRFVLVSKQRISPTLNGRPRPRCWNRTAHPTEEYDVILPEQISISGVHSQTTMDQLLSGLISQAIPAPLHTTWSSDGSHRIACLDFATPEDAAMVVGAVASLSLAERSQLKANYRTAKITQAIYEPVQSSQQHLPSPNSSVHQTPLKRPISMRRGSEQFASLDSLSIHSSSKQSTHASSVDPAGYTSGDSATTMRSVYSGHSSLRPSRRRRLPASTAGYTCRAEDCNRTFNRAGDRTKHERIHFPNAQSHPSQQHLPSPNSSVHQTPLKRPISMRRGSEQFASLDSLSIHSSSKQSTHASSVDPAGYTSGDSATTMRSVYSGHSSLRPSRRRRLPASTAGYTCRAEDCNRTFNRAGDRTKHERIHFPNAQSHPYECKRCSKTFMYPKDLRRHEAIHDRREQPSVSHPRNNPAAGANNSWCMRIDASTGGACKAIFMDREHEREHLRTSHGQGADTFICPVCNIGGYSLRSDLLEHLYIEHGD
nr:zinc finger protein 718 [Quercus suber]